MNNKFLSFYLPLIEQVFQRHNGATFNTYTGTFAILNVTEGFAVSVPGFEQKIPVAEFEFATHVRQYLEREDVQTALRKSTNGHFGIWVDKIGGYVYLDVSQVVQSQSHAAKLAVEGDQLCFFEFETGDVFYVRDIATREVLPEYRKWVPIPLINRQAAAAIDLGPTDAAAPIEHTRTGEKPYVDAWSREVRLNPRGA